MWRHPQHEYYFLGGAKLLMQSYQRLLQDILNCGEPHDDRTGVGTLSVFGRQWRHRMGDGFPLLTTKKVPLRWVAEELFWFLSGSTNEHDLQNRGVDIWQEWATPEQCAKFGRKTGDLGHVYGGLWRNYMQLPYAVDGLLPPDEWPKGNDQIAALLHDLEVSPNSRRLIVSGWHPVEQRRVALPPCHTLWQVKCHGDDSMSLHLYARSIDAFLGLPFNIASYGLLLLLLAKVTGRSARDLIISFGDLHLYKNHVEQAKEQIGRPPRPLPEVHLSDTLSGAGLEGLLSASFSQVCLEGYDPHPAIKAEVAI